MPMMQIDVDGGKFLRTIGELTGYVLMCEQFIRLSCKRQASALIVFRAIHVRFVLNTQLIRRRAWQILDKKRDNFFS
mgnify:CR=1 FL=1